MQPVGDIADDQLGSFRTATRIDRSEPSQPLRQPITEGVEHAIELLLDRIFGRFHRGDQLVPQFGGGLTGQRADKSLAAAKMVQDQRV